MKTRSRPHFPVEIQVLGDIPGKYLEGTSVVFYVEFGNTPDHKIGDLGWDFFKQGILSLLTDPCDHIEFSAKDKGQHVGDVCRVVLQVPVHRYDVLPLGIVKPRSQRKALSVIFFQGDQMHLRVFQLLYHAPGAIRGEVIDIDDLILVSLQALVDLFSEQRNILLLVVERDYDGQQGIG